LNTAVVILNFNGRKWLEKFLPSVVANSDEADIYVIDNGSTDDSVLFLKENFPQIKVIVNESNYWFAGGYNEGLKHITADYYILLNSDIEVTQNWITPVIQLLESDENIVAAQPKILAYHNKQYFEHAGAGGGMIDKNGYPFCRGRIFDHVEKDEGQYDDTAEIFWASGACLFIKAKSFHEFGGFDASYLAHMEEIDLCWRMKNSGKKIMYCGSSSVYHVGGGTLNYVNPQKTYLNFRNSLFTLYKNLDKGLFIKILTRLFLDSLAAAKFLFSGKIRHIGSIFKAHFHFYKNISQLKKKRKQMKYKSFTGMKGMYSGNIVWQHFGRKKKTFKDL
jgi:GT2 family glycosyltransferase